MYTNKEFQKFIQKSKKEKLDVALTFVADTKGSTFAKKGALMLVNSKGEFAGVLGSGFLQEKIIKNSQISLKTTQEQDFKSIAKEPSSGHGNSQYKTIPFYFEDNYKDIYTYVKKPYSLLIFGSGAHINPLISMANLMGWQTTVIDINIKEEFVSQAGALIKLQKLEEIMSFDLSDYNAAVILSHNPKTDDIYLEALLKSKLEYIGLMGNKTNAKRKKEQFDLENDKRFFAPIGFDIGSYTPESIALSICAQIESRKNGKI